MHGRMRNSYTHALVGIKRSGTTWRNKTFKGNRKCQSEINIATQNSKYVLGSFSHPLSTQLNRILFPLTGTNDGCITAAHYDYCHFITCVTIAQIQMESEIIQDLICSRYVGNSLCRHTQIRSLIHPAYRCYKKIIEQVPKQCQKVVMMLCCHQYYWFLGFVHFLVFRVQHNVSEVKPSSFCKLKDLEIPVCRHLQ